MRKGNIGVAPEGLPFLFLLALTALAFAALRFWPLALVFLVLTWFSGHFFRDPSVWCSRRMTSPSAPPTVG